MPNEDLQVSVIQLKAELYDTQKENVVLQQTLEQYKKVLLDVVQASNFELDENGNVDTTALVVHLQSKFEVADEPQLAEATETN